MCDTREVDLEDLYRNLNIEYLGDENYTIYMGVMGKLTDKEVELLSRIVWWNII